MMRNIDEFTGAFTMFPLDSNNDNPLFQLLLPDYQNPENFPNLLSPFFDEHELPLNQILTKNLLMAAPDHHRDQDQCTDGATVAANRPPASKVKADTALPRRRSLGSVPRRRTGKKDRHSKISTAQGIRDRRMRLSLQVARKFFDLQDMLGYDKASKTIEWLFSKSRKAIKELTGNNSDNLLADTINSISDTKSESFISDCEVVSGIDHENYNFDQVKEDTDFPTSGTPPCVEAPTAARKSSVRESREKARARARCRTREKQMIKGLENPSHIFDQFQTLGSLNNNPFEARTDFQEESVSINPVDYPALADVGTIEKLLGTSSDTSCLVPDYYSSAAVSSCIDPGSNIMGLLGCWDLLNSDRMNNPQSETHPTSVDYNIQSSFFPLYHQ